MCLTRFASVLIVCLFITSTLSADDNKDEAQGSINDSYQIVKWGKEIDYVEYVKFIASLSGGPPAVAAYFW